MEAKQVTLDLVGLNGNAFSLMGAFSRAAKGESWTQDEINHVLKDCTSGDYDHLLRVLMEYTKPTQDEND